MIIRDVRDILNAEVLCGEHLLDRQAEDACGADLMSDVLAGIRHNALLLTGLCSLQALRTAEMIEACAVVFVRDKRPDAEMLKLARELHMPVMTTPLTLYHACGKLYERGLQPDGGGAT
jgi:predicted transcriptional regulator